MSLYEYICAKCSEYKQELAKHYLLTKEYFRLQIREHPICKGDQPISKEFLQKIYNIEITTKNKKKYRSKFLKNCKDLMNKLEDDKYVQFTVDTLYSVIPREKIMPEKYIDIEMIVNLMFFFCSLKLSWSDYLIAFPSGQKLIMDIFLSPKKSVAVANLIMIIKTIYVMNLVDPVFKQELFRLLPNINEIVKDTVFETWIVKWMSDKISTVVFMKGIENL